MFLYWVWYMYNCAVGNNSSNGDQMCQSVYRIFSAETFLCQIQIQDPVVFLLVAETNGIVTGLIMWTDRRKE